jgi:hypothetical protein
MHSSLREELKHAIAEERPEWSDEGNPNPKTHIPPFECHKQII